MMKIRNSLRIILAGAMLATTMTALTTPAHAASDPTGNLDHATVVDNGIRVRGWAWDPDSANSVSVKVTVGSTTTTVIANGTRTDVPRVFPKAGNKRGFDVVVPVSVGNYTVSATAVNIGGGSNKTFPTKTVTVLGKPGPNTTGVPSGVSLKRHNGDLTITQSGQVIDGMDIRGFVTIKAPDVVIKNSRIRGGQAPSTHRALVTVGSPNYSVTIQDSELAPDTAHWNIDGVRGMNITAERINIHNVIDHFHIYGDNVTIRDSWLHDNAHFDEDPNWPLPDGRYGPSHDDNIQIQGGRNIWIENNNISGSHSAAIMVTQDRARVTNLTIQDNFLDDGGCVVNFKLHKDGRSAPAGVRIWDNTFGCHATWSTCGIKNPDTSFNPDLKNNKFTNGEAVGITR